MQTLFRPRHFILALLLTILAGWPAVVDARDNTTRETSESLTRFSTGFHHYDSKGYHGKVSEYTLPDTGFDASFQLRRAREEYYFNLNSEILDKDDQTHHLEMDLKRYFHMDLSYMQFRHFLDHDSLSNQAFLTDINPGANNSITIEETKADNTFRLPALPFVKFFVNLRKYEKHGSRQTTTVSKDCSSCHITSVNKRIDQSTDEMKLGFEARIRNTTVNYQYFGRDFNEGRSAPQADYGRGASFFQFQGVQPYGDTPDFKNSSHKLSLHTKLPFATTLFAAYRFGTRSNREIHEDVDFSSFSARLSKYFSRFISCDLFYGNYQMDNDIDDAFERDIEKGGIDIKARLLKKTSVKFNYKWQDIDRHNFAENSTRKTSYSLAMTTRLIRGLRLHLLYKICRVDDPFILEDNRFTRTIIQTSLPEKERQVYASLSWSPLSAFSLNTSVRSTHSRNTEYQVDEELFEFVLSTWYMPFERMTLIGSFTIYKNETDTAHTYKPVHLSDEDSLLLNDNVPYDHLSTSFFLSATYRLSPRLAITGDMTFINSDADFDMMLDDENIGRYSDLDIHQIRTSAGFNYLVNRRVSLYGKYAFHEYDDRKNSSLDGEYSMISIGLNYSF